MRRRLFVGDLHGCADELDQLLDQFAFSPDSDGLYSVGDIVGKGPKPRETLALLRRWKARVVQGNHDAYCLKAAASPELDRNPSQQYYVKSLGGKEERETYLAQMFAWPHFLEEDDIILVHAGLQPGISSLTEMPPRVLLNIRTWDGKGVDLKSENNPPWFECIDSKKTIVFGHWAKRGLIDLPKFKGLDTGCVYGKKLTGWCPEENRFYQVPARRAYATIRED